MKNSLSLAVVAAALVAATSAASAAPLPINPGVANAAAQRSQQTDVLYWYNLLPANVFGAFGNVNRLELLQSQGAVYDQMHGFIEVFAPGDANKNDVEKLQVKLYKGNQGLMVAVSQVVWNQPNVKGALGFFALSNDGGLFDVTRQVFPFDLNAPTTDAPTTNAPVANAPTPNAPANGARAGQTDKKSAPPVNAYLARNGTTIETGVAESKESGETYSWNGTIFSQRNARPDNRN